MIDDDFYSTTAADHNIADAAKLNKISYKDFQMEKTAGASELQLKDVGGTTAHTMSDDELLARYSHMLELIDRATSGNAESIQVLMALVLMALRFPRRSPWRRTNKEMEETLNRQR